MIEEMEDVQNKADYMKGCLPLNQFHSVRDQFSNLTEELIEELEKTGKEVIINQMKTGRDYWSYFLDKKEENENQIKEQYSFRDFLYYMVSMRDSGLKTSIHPFELNNDENNDENFLKINEDSDENLEEILRDIENGMNKKAFSKMGSDIWNIIEEDDIPKMRFGYVEDEDHIYYEFWSKGISEVKFHERKGDFVEFPILRKISSRVHLDEEVIEIRGRNERNKDIRKVKENIKESLDDNIKFEEGEFEIRDEDIRYFLDLPEFDSAHHAGHDGAAKSKWTAEDDLTQDDRYPQDRPHDYKNMTFDIQDLEEISFQLSVQYNSFRIFKHNLLPENHKKVVEFILRNLYDSHQT